jgi:hypothetical protein
LGDIKDPRAVEPLIAALKDTDSHVRFDAAWALGQIKDPRAVEPLIVALKDTGTYSELQIHGHVSAQAAQALGQIKDPRAVSSLLAVLRERNTQAIAAAYTFFIELGEPGSEDALIETLNKSGTLQMADELLNCGNSKLERAAQGWAQTNGYRIMHLPTGESSVRWGSNQ